MSALVMAAGLGWLLLAVERPEPVVDVAQGSTRPSAAASWVAPRLSLVVLPFQNFSGDPRDDYLADAITDDLTSDLSSISGAFVIARQSAYTYRGKPTDVWRIGEDLGVRYIIEGSMRRIGAMLRINVQLTSAETGAHLWSDRFDQEINELAAGQEQIVTRMRSELGVGMLEIEAMRSLRERPGNPGAFDLILRARALGNIPPSRQRNEEAKLLFERALEKDPLSVPALLGIAYYLTDSASTSGHWSSIDGLQRAERLLDRASAVAPHSSRFLYTMAYWLRARGRCNEALVFAEEVSRRFPNFAPGYSQLAQCKIITGQAAEAIPLIEKAIRVNPRDPSMFHRYRVMGYASLMLGKDSESIAHYERALAVSAEDDGSRHWTWRGLAAARGPGICQRQSKQLPRRTGFGPMTQYAATRPARDPARLTLTSFKASRMDCASRANATTPTRTQTLVCRSMTDCTAKPLVLRRQPCRVSERSTPATSCRFSPMRGRLSSTL